MITENIILCSECVTAQNESNKCQCLMDRFSISRMSLQASDVTDSSVVSTNDVSDLPVNQNSSETSQVVTFVDSSTGQIDDVSFEYSPIASSSGTLNTSLEHFLRRPTRIDTRTWTTATSNGVLGTVIEPWYLFLNNSVIKNKLNNYAFIRAKLCMKIVINATPFHYGCLRVAYEPNINASGTGDRTSKVRTNPVSSNPLIIPYSQLPGVWVLPATNSGGEIHVPYFRHTNWLPLKSAANVRTMGALTYYVAFPLSLASASASTSVSIDTFAWLEDVELGGSTAELTLQAKDEFDGVVSAPAKAIATASAAFSNLPVIGKFAKATSIGAGAVANIANLFGFTNTPVIDDVHAVVPVPGIHLSSSEIGTPLQKLSLDPKQELSIDPTMHGIPSTDEMIIENIIKKKSALVMDGWSTSDTAGTVIFNARVNPGLFGTVDIEASGVKKADRVYHTPMSYLGMMFTHWRGDIIFEVEAICTKFHKGRLKIAWDPIGGSGAAALDENTVYTTILDIGENNKALFRVPYHQAYAWCRTRGIAGSNWSVGNSLPSTEAFDNGLFIVSVLTPLMSPVSPQNIGLKISVYSASVEFANPRSQLAENSTSSPPSFFAVQSADVQDEEASMVTFGDVGVDHPKRYSLNFGERIVSLRTLLHRYSLYDVSCAEPSTATRAFYYVKSYTRHPPMFGYDPNGKSLAYKSLTVSGSANFNYTPTHPITYVEMMYGASSGSVNYVVNTSCDLYPYIGDIRVQRINDSAFASRRAGIITANINSGFNASVYNRFLNFQEGNNCTQYTGGAAFTNTQTNSALNWNYPMMTGVNFNYTDPNAYVNGANNDQTNRECVSLELLVKQDVSSTTSKNLTLTTFAGSGPDYNCLWWLCCPTLDYYTSIPYAP